MYLYAELSQPLMFFVKKLINPPYIIFLCVPWSIGYILGVYSISRLQSILLLKASKTIEGTANNKNFGKKLGAFLLHHGLRFYDKKFCFHLLRYKHMDLAQLCLNRICIVLQRQYAIFAAMFSESGIS